MVELACYRFPFGQASQSSFACATNLAPTCMIEKVTWRLRYCTDSRAVLFGIQSRCFHTYAIVLGPAIISDRMAQVTERDDGNTWSTCA
jgi:hypothetical protein